jgi:hypothetical protein
MKLANSFLTTPFFGMDRASFSPGRGARQNTNQALKIVKAFHHIPTSAIHLKPLNRFWPVNVLNILAKILAEDKRIVARQRAKLVCLRQRSLGANL